MMRLEDWFKVKFKIKVTDKQYMYVYAAWTLQNDLLIQVRSWPHSGGYPEQILMWPTWSPLATIVVLWRSWRSWFRSTVCYKTCNITCGGSWVYREDSITFAWIPCARIPFARIPFAWVLHSPERNICRNEDSLDNLKCSCKIFFYYFDLIRCGIKLKS